MRLDQLESELEQCQRRIAILNESCEQKAAEIAQIHVRIGQESHTLNQLRVSIQ